MPQSHTARRALAAARKRGELERAPRPAVTSRPRSRPATAAAWPPKITHAELDELAAANRITFEEGLSKADKQTVLTAAGVTPEA